MAPHTYRLRDDDERALDALAHHLDLNHTGVIRRAIHSFAGREGLLPPDFSRPIHLADLERHGARTEWRENVQVELSDGKSTFIPWSLHLQIGDTEMDVAVPKAWSASEADRRNMEPAVVRAILEAAWNFPELAPWVRDVAA